MMNSEDMAIFQQAIELARSGQKETAYARFSELRQRGNPENPDLLLWIAYTTPYQVEEQQILDRVGALAPYHPGLPAARQSYAQRYQVQQMVPVQQAVPVAAFGVGPVIHCPLCHAHAPALVQQRISTAGWITFGVLLFVFLPLFWIGLLIKENYYVCSRCGVRLGNSM
ncbi:MAG TPA: LITAF-like zinc ribbon domain-containing protein [Ktedonobacteraceae bacterium]|nr:LITAF-like zinc ribbon domain-containing protein [Ktedonobacteraceae bacterium]